jgi:hypothetical protein
MVDKIGGALYTMEVKRNAYKVLARKLERKIPFGRPRNRWKDNTVTI